MSVATIGLHGVVRVEVERFTLSTGTTGIEIEVTDEDGNRTTLNLFTRASNVRIEGLEDEQVAA